MDFKEWLFLENLQIFPIDEEDNWEEAEQAMQIAKMSGIHIARNKHCSIIAMWNDKVIGAAFTSWSNDDEHSAEAGEPWGKWDFDVVVHPDYRGNKLVGMKLIKAAEQMRAEMEEIHGQKGYTSLWVVNPKLAQILQTKRYGYDVDADYGDGGMRLRKY